MRGPPAACVIAAMSAPTAPAPLGDALGHHDHVRREARFRYGLVFFVTFVLLVFQTVAPSAAWSRAVALALELLALAVVVATSRERESVRRARLLATTAAGVGLLIVVVVADVGVAVAFFAGGFLAVLIPAALVGGVVRLIRDRGVTLHAVSGALTIYLYVGLLFAWAIAFVSAVSSAPFFAESHVGQGDRVYYSFTVLTTTGFGDFTPAMPVGHALAVVEMLIGQLYLVTVIGVLVGQLVGRPRR